MVLGCPYQTLDDFKRWNYDHLWETAPTDGWCPSAESKIVIVGELINRPCNICICHQDWDFIAPGIDCTVDANGFWPGIDDSSEMLKSELYNFEKKLKV